MTIAAIRKANIIISLVAASLSLAALSIVAFVLLRLAGLVTVPLIPDGVGLSAAVPAVIHICGFAALAVVIISRSGSNRALFLFAVALASHALYIALNFLQSHAPVAGYSHVLALLDAVGLSALLRFAQLFPRPLNSYELATGSSVNFAARATARFLQAFLVPSRLWLFTTATFYLLAVLKAFVLFFLMGSLWLLTATYYMYSIYKRASPTDRRRIFWVLEGLIVFAAGVAAMAAFIVIVRLLRLQVDANSWLQWMWVARDFASLSCFYIAVFHSGVLDPRLVIRRTTVISAATGLIIVVFVAVEEFVTDLLVSVLGERGKLATWAAAVIAALAYRPVAQRIDRWLANKTARHASK